jgi:phosphatidylglycerol---prolipoprotein diacylglyceryl transferase
MMNTLGVLPYWQVGPWSLGPLTIHSFGLMVAIGLIWGFTMAGMRGKRVLGVDPEEVHNFGMWLVIIGWFFSHVFAVLFYSPHEILENPLVLLKVWGEISSYGGILGGMIALYFWRRKYPDRNVLDWANLAAYTLPFCYFFGRVGCALVHDHPGVDVTNFWLWEKIRAVFGDGLPEIWPLAMQFPDGVYRHDLGFYEAIWWVFLVAFVLIADRKPRRRGFFLWTLPLLYAPVRFALDFLRTADTTYFGLTPAHYISVAMFVLGIYLWYRFRNLETEQWVNPPRAA